MKKLALLLIILTSTTAYSQPAKHYFSIGVNTGLSGYDYKIENGSTKIGLGSGTNFIYDFYFSENWGIGTGFGFSFYSSKGRFSNLLTSFENQVDAQGNIYRKDVYLNDWEEKQTGSSFDIPILLKYRFELGKSQKLKLYAGMGLKLQIPFQSNFKITKGNIVTEQTSTPWDVFFQDVTGRVLYGDGYRIRTKNNLKSSLGGMVNLGIQYMLNPAIELFCGAELDYGFNNIIPSEADELLYISTKQKVTYRGILSSSLVNKAKMFSLKAEFGIRFNLDFKVDRSKETVDPEWAD